MAKAAVKALTVAALLACVAFARPDAAPGRHPRHRRGTEGKRHARRADRRRRIFQLHRDAKFALILLRQCAGEPLVLPYS